MNRRKLWTGALLLLGLVMLAGVWHQRQQLAVLRSEQRRLLAQMAHTDPPETGLVESAGSDRVPAELLRLRSQITQLTERQREYAQIRAENDRLRASASAIDATAQNTNVPFIDYVRLSAAQWVGLNTPEHSFESYLWLLKNRAFTDLPRILTPDAMNRVRDSVPPSEFHFRVTMLAAVRVVNQERLSDTHIRAQLETIPRLRFVNNNPLIQFQLIDGEWRVDVP